MIIRPSGASGGFKDYLERGQKKGRDLDRDALDERIPIAGNLDFFEAVTKAIQYDGERYTHYVISFDEHYIPREILNDAVREFVGYAMSAFNPDEYAFYAEVHKARIESYIDSQTGKEIQRLNPFHIHIAIAGINLQTGERIEPFGYVTYNIPYIDAFQEDFNARYGLHSPKDSPRLDGKTVADLLKQKGRPLPADLSLDPIHKDIANDDQRRNTDDIGRGGTRPSLVDVEGDSRAAGYLNAGDLNPKLRTELIGLRLEHGNLKMQLMNEIISGTIKDYDALIARLRRVGDVDPPKPDDKRDFIRVRPHGASKNIRLNGIVFSRAFLAKPLHERQAIVREKSDHLYREARAARKSPAYTQPLMDTWRRTRAREVRYFSYDMKNPGRASDLYRTQYLPADPATKAKILDQIEADNRSKQHGNGHNGESHDRHRGTVPPPVGRGRLRTLSELDVVRLGEGSTVLLQDDVSRYVAERQRRQDAARGALRRRSDGVSGWPIDGRRQSSSVPGKLRYDAEDRERQAKAPPEVSVIKSKLDATLVLDYLAHDMGVDVARYRIEKHRDGHDLIRCGSRVFPINDFLTKERSMPWNEAAPLLRRLYAFQQHRELGREILHGRTEKSDRTLWNEFKRRHDSEPTRADRWTAQREGERTRREAIKRHWRSERDRIRAIHSPVERKVALSIARMAKVQTDMAIRHAIGEERANLKYELNTPLGEMYKGWLAEQAQAGDDRAMEELLRQNRPRWNHDVGNTIRSADPQAELPRAKVYALPAYTHRVQRNGTVTYQRDGQDVLVDQDKKLVVLRTDDTTTETALRLAMQKFGTKLQINGTPEFKERAALLVAELGFPVEFADPTLNRFVENHRAMLEVARQQAAAKADRTDNVGMPQFVAGTPGSADAGRKLMAPQEDDVQTTCAMPTAAPTGRQQATQTTPASPPMECDDAPAQVSTPAPDPGPLVAAMATGRSVALNVPYAERKEAGAAGVKFDRRTGVWMAVQGLTDPERAVRWYVPPQDVITPIVPDAEPVQRPRALPDEDLAVALQYVVRRTGQADYPMRAVQPADLAELSRDTTTCEMVFGGRRDSQGQRGVQDLALFHCTDKTTRRTETLVVPLTDKLEESLRGRMVRNQDSICFDEYLRIKSIARSTEQSR